MSNAAELHGRVTTCAEHGSAAEIWPDGSMGCLHCCQVETSCDCTEAANTPRTLAELQRLAVPLDAVVVTRQAYEQLRIGLVAAPTPARCDQIVNNGMGEPTECGRTLPCEVHDAPTSEGEHEAGWPFHTNEELETLRIAAIATAAPTPAEPLNTILQAIVQHCSDANMTFDDLRVLNRLIEKVEQAAAPTPAEPLDECPCGHDENEHVHYCSAITDDGQSCGCVQNYVRLAAARSDTPAEPERIPSSDSEAWNEKDGHRAWLAESEGLTDPEGHGIVDHHAAQEEEGVTRKTGRSTTV